MPVGPDPTSPSVYQPTVCRPTPTSSPSTFPSIVRRPAPVPDGPDDPKWAHLAVLSELEAGTLPHVTSPLRPRTTLPDIPNTVSPPASHPDTPSLAVPPSSPVPSVGFRAPILGIVVAGLKRLDMRFADDPATCRLLPGALVRAHQGHPTPFSSLLRITSIRPFNSPADAYAYYLARDMQRSLFPPSWCYLPGHRPISTPSDAELYYAQLCSMPAEAARRPVRVFTVEVVDAAPQPGISPSLPLRSVSSLSLIPRPVLPPRIHHPSASQQSPSPSAPPPITTPLPAFPPARASVWSRLPPRRPAPADLPRSTKSSTLPPYTPLTAAAVDAASESLQHHGSALVERCLSAARHAARARGAASVTARDYADAFAVAAGRTSAASSPAEVDPVHISSIRASLSALRSTVLALQLGDAAGPRRVRVLVVGEKSAVIARMFAQAGADVATCDMYPTEDPSIPHFQGDAAYIQDLGWDLVVAHPPCTYLSNAGLVWLHNDPDRWSLMIQNASVFRRQYHVRAPFVAVENSIMHRHGQRLVGTRPTQIVHPWQHGTGHVKATALYLRNLPALRPTAIVPGREQAMARLPPSPDRSERRSRTYKGIAAAMALQWMPVLMDYVRKTDPSTRSSLSAREMVAAAAGPGSDTANVVFVRSSSRNNYNTTVAVVQSDTLQPVSCPVDPLGSDNPDPSAAVSAHLSRHIRLPNRWQLAVREALRDYAFGHHSSAYLHEGHRHTIYTWVIDVSYLEREAVPLSREPTSDGALPRFGWVASDQLLPWPSAPPDAAADYAARSVWAPPPPIVEPRPAFDVVAAAPGDPHLCHTVPAESPSSLPESFRPWLTPPSDRPPPPPAPRHVRFSRGKWRAWTTGNSTPPSLRPDEPDSPSYRWVPLPPDVQGRLNGLLRPPPAVLPIIPESELTLDPSTSDAIDSACVAAVQPVRAHFTTLEMERLWNAKPPPPSAPYLGLGADLSTKPSPPLPGTVASHPRHRGRAPPGMVRRQTALSRAEAYRSSFRRWVPASGESTVASASPPDTTLTPAHQAMLRRAEQRLDWNDVPADSGAPSVVAVANLEDPVSSPPAFILREDEVAITPHKVDLDPQALFVENVYLLRRAQTRKKADQKYVVRCAVAGRKLCDTGAAPAIVTTGFLDRAPADCLYSRNRQAECRPLVGPDGNPLRTEGTADITFDLNGTICRHTFIVVVGKPLLIFGTDFLEPRDAVIRLNVDGQGTGTLELSSVASTGKTINHTARVTTVLTSAPRLAASATIVLDGTSDACSDVVTTSTSASHVNTSDPPSVASDATGQSDSTEPTATPIPAAELTADALQSGAYHLESSEHLLYAQRPIPLEGRHITRVLLRAPKELCDRPGATCFVERLPVRDGLEKPPLVVSKVAPVENGYVEVEIVNLERRKVYIPASSPVAYLDTEYYVRGALDPEAAQAAAELRSGASTDYYAALSKEQRALVDSVKVDPDKRLNDEQLERVRQLVARNVDAFALDAKNPTKTHLLEVELPLKPDATPHRHSASRLGEAGRAIVEKHIDEMESRGIIRKSNSPWGSRVVLVSKKDGSIRFCVDYRDLNSKLQFRDSPLPLTVEAIDRLSSGQGPASSLFLSTLDLASGFWCLPIKEEHKELTAFVTHRSKYEFNYLPFGIQSGPSYMCRLMDAALQGLAWESCMPYLDDVGCWSTGSGSTPEERELSSFEQMMTRLSDVFERLRWAGLSMKASKCTLFATSAEYLGHVIGRSGLSMDPNKIKAVAAVDPTSINTVERVRSFLGLCSYYRRFISCFSKIAAPLHDLTKDGVDVATLSQSDKCQEAIRTLITAITTEPVLATPRFDRPFIVKTDAANTEGIGGVLSQVDDDGRERVIAYYGRRLNKHERHYTVTEIELLAAVESIKAWRPYLWGREFKLVIDHSALRWLHTMRDTMEGGPASRLMRWILRLQEYNFTVEHKPGIIHKDADGVSRLVAPVLVSPVLRPRPFTTHRGRSSRRASRGRPVDRLPTVLEERSHNGVDPTRVPPAATVASASPPAPPSLVAPVMRAAVPTARRIRAAQRKTTDRDAIVESYLSPGSPLTSTLRDEQHADPLCIAIRRYLAEGHAGDVSSTAELRRATWLSQEVCPSSDGQRRFFVDDDVLYRRLTADRAVPFVPASLTGDIIAAFHDRAGHPSASRTRSLIRTRYYWPDMDRQVNDHVSSCHECTLSAKPRARPRRPVGPTVGDYPFDVLYADILSMAKTHDYDAANGVGASKLIVFVDSLTRWVEAIPLHRDPTSEQIMDIFMEHVVSRHGAPRRIVTDNGSNLASRLCSIVHEKTGVDLATTGAEHHEGVGTVERFQQTLVGMTRATNDGGSHWVDHLPFLLLSYRSTPHRVTGASPAALLYGRELRLPAQLDQPIDPRPDESAENRRADVKPPAEDPPSDDVLAYARRLHRRLVYAWRSAREATREAQGATVADTTRTATTPPSYAVGDRVARRLYDSANKLEYTYAGPYRIEAVLDNGRYRLTDLENNHTVKEFDVSNLRPYHTHVDAEALQSDEYLVDELLDRRGRRNARQYLVKWRGHPRDKATWEPRSELERRCAELLLAYDAVQDQPRIRHVRAAPPAAEAPAPAEPPSTAPPPAAVDPASVTSHLPHTARFERGAWLYGRHVTGPRGVQLRMLPARNFTADELASEHFVALRRGAASALPSHVVAAVSSEPAFDATRELSPDHRPVNRHAAKIWFSRVRHGEIELLSFVRADADPARPQFDTFGGKMEFADNAQYHRCGLRELREEAKCPKQWDHALGDTLAGFPEGQRCVTLTRRGPPTEEHRVALWVVPLDADVHYMSIRATANGAREMVPDSLAWRPASAVCDNLHSFYNVGRPAARALRELLAEHHTTTDA